MVATDLFKADVGQTIIYSLIVGLPTAIIAGPLFGQLIAQAHPRCSTGGIAGRAHGQRRRGTLPGFGLTVLTILLPVS